MALAVRNEGQMRGKGALIVVGVVILLAAAVAGTLTLAQRGGSSADADAERVRSTFIASRGTAAPAGTTTVVPGSTAVAGSAVVGKSGTPGPGDVTTVSGGPPITGTVTKVLSGVFTIQQADTTSVDIATTAETSVTKTKAAALSDLKVGDLISVEGEKSGDGAYSASAITTLAGLGGPGGAVRQVITVPPTGGPVSGGAPAGGFVATTPAGASSQTGGGTFYIGGGAGDKGTIGKVTKVEGGTLTLETPDGGTATVRTDAKTTFRAQVVANVNDIKSGDRVTVIGDKTGDALYTARVIEVRDAPTGG